VGVDCPRFVGSAVPFSGEALKVSPRVLRVVRATLLFAPRDNPALLTPYELLLG